MGWAVDAVTVGQTPQARKATLLESADIQGWIKDHRSPNTAKVQFEQLELFSRRIGIDPAGIAALAAAKPNKEFRGRVVDWVNAEREQGRPDLYIKTVWYAVKSWLRYNEVSVDWSPPLDVQPAATLEAERVPTSEELRRLVSVLSPRDRAAVLILASSGVRLGVLASRFEAAGLTLEHLPDLVLGGRIPRFARTPAILRIPAKLSKTRKEYYSFITTEAAEALIAYLQERRSRGEKLTPASAVIGPEPKASHAHFRRGRENALFISGKSLGQVIRLGLRKVMPKGVRVRPHTLRGWTSTQLELAERGGKITRSLREYFLGHGLKSVEVRYNLGKHLSQESLEELRAAYKRCEPLLSTASPAATPAEEIQREAAILLLTGFKGMKADDARTLVEGKSGEELANLLKPNDAATSRPREKAVTIDEVPDLLERGWELVAPLNGTMAVLRSPVASGIQP